jgi:predicted nucleic acid-binding protein
MLIAAEREKKQVSQVLALLEDTQRETQFFLSAITVMELEHGWYRADSAERAAS